MKKIVIFAVFILAACGFASAQTAVAELNKIKQIKLLESDRKDVKKILTGYEVSDDKDYYQDFVNDIAYIEVWYSNGNCLKKEIKGDEEDDESKV